MTSKALVELDHLWYRNDNGRMPQRQRGDLKQWVGKVEVVRGETAETIAQEAFRLWELSVALTEVKEPDVQEPESPADEQTRAGKTPEALQEAPTADSDPDEPLVTVEQTEESKRKDYVEETTFGQIRRPPKPYHLTINRPQDNFGWLAAHDQLFLDGPTYTSQYYVLEQMRVSLVAPPFSDDELDKPIKPDEHTCFDEFRRLMAQWVLKLPKDELEKLRKIIHRTSNPKYWEKVAKELSA